MRVAFWISRALLSAIALLALAWLAAYADQWWVRWRAHKLLAEVRSVEVGKTSEADVRRVIDAWRSANSLNRHYCLEDGCDYGVGYSTYLPKFLVGYGDFGDADERDHKWLPSLASHMGLRPSAVSDAD